MSEPFFVSQTFDSQVVGDEDAAKRWFELRAKEAFAEGGTWPRYTISDDGRGLLFECWKVRPANEGAPRWQFRAHPDA